MKKEKMYEFKDARGVRITMEAGERMESHTAPGRVFISCCKGRCLITLPEMEINVSEGDVVDLAPGVPHSVEAKEYTVLYLTLFLGEG